MFVHVLCNGICDTQQGFACVVCVCNSSATHLLDVLPCMLQCECGGLIYCAMCWHYLCAHTVVIHVQCVRRVVTIDVVMV